MDFVASVSHELRTPLTSIFCVAENIKDGIVGDKSSLTDYGSMVMSQARRLMDYVDRISAFRVHTKRQRTIQFASHWRSQRSCSGFVAAWPF